MRCVAEPSVAARVDQGALHSPTAASSAFCASGSADIVAVSLQAARTASRLSARNIGAALLEAALVLGSVAVGPLDARAGCLRAPPWPSRRRVNSCEPRAMTMWSRAMACRRRPLPICSPTCSVCDAAPAWLTIANERSACGCTKVASSRGACVSLAVYSGGRWSWASDDCAIATPARLQHTPTASQVISRNDGITGFICMRESPGRCRPGRLLITGCSNHAVQPGCWG